MSEPGLFVLIAGQKRRFFGDRWAAAWLHRELVWGPQEFEQWASQLEELDEMDGDFSGGVVADFDNRRLVWTASHDGFEIPRVGVAFDRLLQTAWPGYDIQIAHRGYLDLAAAAGEPIDGEDHSQSHRYPTLRAAARLDGSNHDDDDGSDDSDEGDGEPYEWHEEDTRAWVTFIDEGGAIRHRQLESLPEELLRHDANVLSELLKLPAAEVPNESVVTEGMWVDAGRRVVGLWGSASTKAALPQVQAGWTGWTVRWADRGYAEQCEASGPCGVPMSDREALAKFLPTVLSNKRFDIKMVMGALGGELKKTAIKATGCLVTLICLPVLIFAVFSGQWTAALITIGIVVALAVGAFQYVGYRLRRTYSPLTGNGRASSQAPPAAGPLDKAQRRQRLDQLLRQAGFPPLNEIEPHFSKDAVTLLLD